MSKERSKQISSRIRPKNRQQKEKQKWRTVDPKKQGNTRLRRISRHRPK